MDRKKRTISLSVKAKESDEEAAAVEEYTSASASGGTSLGDIIKEQMDSHGEDDNNN